MEKEYTVKDLKLAFEENSKFKSFKAFQKYLANKDKKEMVNSSTVITGICGSTKYEAKCVECKKKNSCKISINYILSKRKQCLTIGQTGLCGSINIGPPCIDCDAKSTCNFYKNLMQ